MGFIAHPRYETMEIQRKVTEVFKQLYDPKYWQEIDADRSVAELQEVLLEAADRSISNVASNELSLLWSKE